MVRARWRSKAIALTLVVAAASVGFVAAPAWAVDYPSWDDVQNAKKDEASKAAEVTRIEGLIADSEAQVAATQAVAEQRGTEYQVAVDAFDTADRAAAALQAQADQGAAAAATATSRAGLLAAQLYRSGGTDLGVNLFLGEDASGADNLLSKLGRVSKLSEVNDGIYTAATTARNTAQSLSDQAAVAKGERERLKGEADAKLQVAIQASTAAQDQLAAQQDLNIVLTQQLAALKDNTQQTVAAYQAGVEEKRKAALASGAGDAGQLSDQGWAKPAGGRITDNFGPRPDQPAGANLYHRGTDLGASCGSPIYAATSGTVVYAGPNGTYGNWIEIRHGEGVSTGYAHIRAGGTFVRVGDYAEAGQNIASVGMTGAATGCHLHFEVRINGTAIDAVPFMRDRGVSLG